MEPRFTSQTIQEPPYLIFCFRYEGLKLICVHPEMVDFDSGHGCFAGDADKDRMKSIFRMAICQGLFYRNGSYVGKV